jgi:hypothetical protein
LQLANNVQGRVAAAAPAAAAGKVMVLEALLKGIKSSEPTDKVVLVSNYTGAAWQPQQQTCHMLCTDTPVGMI